MKTSQAPRHAGPVAAARQTSMQAIVQRRYGTVPDDVLRLAQIARPRLAAGEVLVQVRAAGLDRGTWHVMAGLPYLIRVMGFGFRRPKNPIAGLDVAGTVVAVGSDVTRFKVGDGVRVHTRVVEGDKERIQIFAGIVIGRKGRGINETFTVRRISYGEGVERVFPVHSPRIAKVEVEKQGRARRAALNYLRKRKGKEATAVREQN